jgi:catechol O-methyltransferase
MQLWRFFMPGALGFTLRNGWHGVLDKLQGRPSRPLQSASYVQANARRGDPASVLATLDKFASEERWLMSVGPEKGPLMQELDGRLPDAPRVLELGAYCGYSAIMMAHCFGDSARVTSIEISSDSVEAARANVDMAGLGSRVEFLHGPSGQIIETLQEPFDLVFLDHWKDLYLQDLQRLGERRLLKPGSIVVADNVGKLFGADDYLNYVRGCGRFQSENRPAHVEYTAMEDAVEISTFTG